MSASATQGGHNYVFGVAVAICYRVYNNVF